MSKRSRLNRSNQEKALWVGDFKAAGDPRNNYVKKLMMHPSIINRKPGAIIEYNVYHDGDCRIFSGGFCDCNPDLKVAPREIQQVNPSSDSK